MRIFKRQDESNQESDEVKIVARKRELEIVKDGQTQFYKFKFKESGGELPNKLKGVYTSYSVAEGWRDLYYAGSLNKA